VYLNPEQLIEKNPSHCNEETIEKKPTHARSFENPSPEEQLILKNLQKPRSIDELHSIYPGDLQTLLALLVQMELLGKIEITGQWVKKAKDEQ